MSRFTVVDTLLRRLSVSAPTTNTGVAGSFSVEVVVIEASQIVLASLLI